MDEAYKEYMEERRQEYAFREESQCARCPHLGKEHDIDEVGECQACGCAAFGYPDDIYYSLSF